MIFHTNDDTPRVLAFGEVLFDCYPANVKGQYRKKIGGAPFNFCAHFCNLGGRAAMLTSVGRDENGALDEMKNRRAVGIAPRLFRSAR